MILEKVNPSNISNFQPINLISCIYKLLSEVLAKRLTSVLHKIIGNSHNVFVFGRQITDVILIANETVDEIIRNNKLGALCKLNMEKIFDHINWDLIDYMRQKVWV